jgi:hypothetical protein
MPTDGIYLNKLSEDQPGNGENKKSKKEKKRRRSMKKKDPNES